MSSGKIVIKNEVTRNDGMEQKVAEIVYGLMPTFEVDVEDDDWKRADDDIKKDVAVLDEKQKENIENIKNLEGKLEVIDKRLGDNQGSLSDEIKGVSSSFSKEIECLKNEITELKKRKPLEVIIKSDKSEPKDLGKQHLQLPTLLKILEAKLNVYIVGPAGAGKTYAAIQCAKALGVDFYFTGAVASEFKLTGFIDAQGKIVSTEFRKAFEKGGLFLFDEIDASYPQAVLAFNAALSNDYMDFPDKRVERHKDFYCIAAANTYGQGADRQYVGRNQLDAASLDRFVFLDWKYDENLERTLAKNQEWSDYVQKIRRYIEILRIRHIVSPRASIHGAKLLANEIPREKVEQTILWKGLDEATKIKILENIAIAPKKIQAPKDGTFSPKFKSGDKVTEKDIIGEIDFYEDQRQDSESTHSIDSTLGTDKIEAQFNGVIVSISGNKEVKKEDTIAEIVCL